MTTEITEFNDIDLPSDEQTLFAMLPLMAGSSKKMAYLGYRATGFTVGKSCELAGVTRGSIQQWRKSDPVFAKWENEELERLQNSIGPQLVKFDFMRSMRMAMQGEMQLIAKSLLGLDGLTPREYEYLKIIRKHYTPQDWLAIEKVLSPEKHQSEQKITINLNWGNRLAETVDGEYKELPESDSVPELSEAEYRLEIEPTEL